MTIREAIDQGLVRVRLPEWHATTYLALPATGPWARLHDVGFEYERGVPILLTELLDDACDRYVESTP